jgi:hypothetical protein
VDSDQQRAEGGLAVSEPAPDTIRYHLDVQLRRRDLTPTADVLLMPWVRVTASRDEDVRLSAGIAVRMR